MRGTDQTRVVVIEGDTDTAARLQAALPEHRVSCEIAGDGVEAWRLLASTGPTAVLIGVSAPQVEVFLRRLRDEYMGRPPRLIAMASAAELAVPVTGFTPEALIMRPAHPQAVARVLFADVPADVGMNHMRELLKLTLLGGDLQSALDACAHRLRLLFRADDAHVLAIAGERHLTGSLGGVQSEDGRAALWERVARAANARAPVIDGDGRTLFAVPVHGAGSVALGAIALASDIPRLYTPDAREALAELATRLGAELSWRAVHERVAEERDRLRESSMVDPLLGIMSRAALEQALATEIARSHRAREPLTVGILDVSGLRVINDRYGHLAGDAVLKHIAGITRQSMRGQDLVARYGGDELAVVLSGTGAAGAQTLIERVCKAVSAESFDAGGDEPVALAVTGGIAEVSRDDETGMLSLSRAAKAVAAARERGVPISIAEAGDSTTALDYEADDRMEAGATLGGMYQIVHEISRGAMGVVYRAEDLGLSRTVALKKLRPDLARDREFVDRFRNEAAVLAALDHDNLVQVYAFGEDRNDVFFVMELVEGVSLEDVLADNIEHGRWLANQRVIKIVLEVAGALDAMHNAGVMHRDVKPGNIVLDRVRDRSVLIDVGLARPLGSASDAAGTPGYIAPESFTGGQESSRTDVYGLAATAYDLLVHEPPFGDADNYEVILDRQLHTTPTPPSQLRRELPHEVDYVFERGLAVQPSDRYRTATELALALEQALMAGTVGDTAPIRAIGDDGQPVSGNSRPRPRGDKTLSLRLEQRPPGAAQSTSPMTRGVLFRAARRLIGHKIDPFLAAVSKTNRQLADAMSAQTTPLGWVPAQRFFDLLAAIDTVGRDPSSFAHDLGVLTVAGTFKRFYPTSDEGLDPARSLSALDTLWQRYHSWGQVRVADAGDREMLVTMKHVLGDTSSCAFVIGVLEQVVAQSGSPTPAVDHTLCSHRGHGVCQFRVRWT